MATDAVQPPSVEPDADVATIDAPTPVAVETLSLPNFDSRERALPIRPGDLNRLLMAQPDLTDLQRDQILKFGSLLGSIFHSEFFFKLRELKELYSPLDPDSDYIKLAKHSRVRSENSDEEFLVPLEKILIAANYRKLDVGIIEQAVKAPNETGLTYVPDFTQFEHLQIYARGYTQISRTVRSAKTRFRKRTMLLDAYQRLVIVLKFRDGLKMGPYIRSDVVYIRMFKDVPHVDMEMHLPEQGTKVKMRWIDKAQIASPVFMGLPTLAAKFLAFSFVSFLSNPLVLAPLMVVPVSAGVNSFFGFHRAKHKHLASMIRNLYYLTLANNGSVLNRLIDSAEEEEYKETMLAYYFLWRRLGQTQEWTMEQLDSHIEEFLREVSDVEINFEIADALGKLYRLGLARRNERGRLEAVPIEEALVVLDRIWDNTFLYA